MKESCSAWLTLRAQCLRMNKSPLEWACGAAGSALPWHGRGHRFDPDQVHQTIQSFTNPSLPRLCRKFPKNMHGHASLTAALLRSKTTATGRLRFRKNRRFSFGLREHLSPDSGERFRCRFSRTESGTISNSRAGSNRWRLSRASGSRPWVDRTDLLRAPSSASRLPQDRRTGARRLPRSSCAVSPA